MRVYGQDPDGPAPGPQPGHDYVELYGGPLDGQLFDVTGWGDDEKADGAYLATELGTYGPKGRADYVPGPHPGRWVWRGDVL